MLVLMIISCTRNAPIKLINSQNFEKEVEGNKIHLFTLRNTDGMVAQITNFGGRVVSLWVRDKDGNLEDVVLGFDNIDDYVNGNGKYFGALIGRYANRIANGVFTLNDSTYRLAKNNGINHLHGGDKGYNDVIWAAKQVSDSKLELKYLSKDGEEGYPGNVKIKVVYELTSNNALAISYEASTDKATPINLTHHSFFNLKGAGIGNVNGHLLQINASHFTPIDKGSVPIGEIRSIKNTPFDFQQLKPIGADLDGENEQLKFGSGYDHNFVLNGDGLRTVAKVIEPNSGRVLEVITDEPGLQFYGGNFLNGKTMGKNGLFYGYRSAFCLETQHFPNSPNQNNFPSVILKPEGDYKQICIYKFSTSK